MVSAPDNACDLTQIRRDKTDLVPPELAPHASPIPTQTLRPYARQCRRQDDAVMGNGIHIPTITSYSHGAGLQNNPGLGVRKGLIRPDGARNVRKS